MQVTVEIPDNLAERMVAAGEDPAREALEAVLVEGYRTGRISAGQIKRSLGYQTRMQVHGLLKDHDVPLNYGLMEYQEDLETLRRMHEREVSAAA